MGQNAHRKLKAYEKAKQKNEGFPSWYPNSLVNDLKLQWESQVKKDTQDELTEIEYYNKTHGKN